MNALRPVQPRGFSLLEMVISLAVIAVLLVGMSSAIVLASRALPGQGTAAGATVQTTRALHQLRDDLHAATELLNRTATSVTLNLPDRDGDGRPEVITYAWANSSGQPLTRTVNQGSAVTLLDNVHSFNLAYTTTSQDQVYPGIVTRSAEVEFSSYDKDSADTRQLNDNNPIGFRFTPTLPASTVNWYVTRVLMRTSAHGNDNGQATFTLSGWDTGVGPDGNIREALDIPETQLDQSGNWAQIEFAGTNSYTPGETAALTLTNSGSATAANITWDNMGIPANAHRSSDGGSTWEISLVTGAVEHFVYGTYDSAGDDWTYTRSFVTDLQITLSHADHPTTSHDLHLPLPNAPEAVDELWEADFNADPTTLDLDDDGSADWQGNPTFDTAGLSGGAWTVSETLKLVNQQTPSAPVRLEAWLQDTTDNSLGGGLEFRLSDGVREAALIVGISLTGSQQLVSLYSKDADNQLTTLGKHTLASSEPARVRLTTNPNTNTVAFEVDDQIIGSYLYVADGNLTHNMLQPYLASGETGIRYQHLRVNIGGSATLPK
ncbi:prepilin-type N-terminal cleavage/methylation domain-containing protein [Algisphaera agarilytica]|uniref:Prepilin-type N-terminal cleavage/methylation domain-containing protein n=1 Tax=Algisphaera agarilytica TaxID=1385975 RepID=A0A7X0LKS9_9BACT|nr:prepilin-type N-terminal cleavage/methylation domain-containing protein [Algisphaera agarilytica]MBB6429258.1 prepilin-type N-terminal cleavage/methylation domain-containing protein [Algisphaera agarilytica]